MSQLVGFDFGDESFQSDTYNQTNQNNQETKKMKEKQNNRTHVATILMVK